MDRRWRGTGWRDRGRKVELGIESTLLQCLYEINYLYYIYYLYYICKGISVVKIRSFILKCSGLTGLKNTKLPIKKFLIKIV